MVGNLGQAELTLASFRQSAGPKPAPNVARIAGLLAACVGLGAMIAVGIEWTLALLAALWIPLLIEVGIWRSIAVGSGDTLRPAVANGVSALGRLLLIPALAIAGLLTVEVAATVLQGSIVVASIVVLAAYVFGQRLGRAGPTLRTIPALRSGASVVLFGAITAITLRGDLLVLQLTSSALEVGVYAAVAALGQSALSVSSYFKSRAQAAVAQSRPADLAREYLLLLGLGAIGSLVVWISSGWIVQILLGPEFIGGDAVLRAYVVASVGLMSLDFVHGVLVALGRVRILNAVAATGAVATLGALFLLVPEFGAQGAAVAVACGTWLASAVGWYVIRTALKA